MLNTAFSNAHVETLLPQSSTYDIHDARFIGIGVRVPPSGSKRFFINAPHRGERVWKIVGTPLP